MPFLPHGRTASRVSTLTSLVQNGTKETQTPTCGYIAGTSYCGSTLLSFLLNAQPGVVSIGELAWSIPKVNPGDYQCSCGATISSCQFWRQVAREMDKRGRAFSAAHWDTAFRVPGGRFINRLAVRSLRSDFADNVRDKLVSNIPAFRERLLEIGARNAALVESIATVAGASVFVDASKDPIRVPFLRRYAGIEPRVIHLIRDSPAFVNSYLRKSNDPQSFSKAIRWWNSTALHMERIKRNTPPNQWLLLRYEDLCANPEFEIQRVLTFLGACGSKPVLQFRHSSHHIIGNTMRLSDTSNIRLDLSWKDALSSSQLDEIRSATRRYRQSFGYEVA